MLYIIYDIYYMLYIIYVIYSTYISSLQRWMFEMRNERVLELVSRRGTRISADGNRVRYLYCARSGFAGEIDPTAQLTKMPANSIRMDGSCTAYLKV
jgi:hypothetical protein